MQNYKKEIFPDSQFYFFINHVVFQALIQANPHLYWVDLKGVKVLLDRLHIREEVELLISFKEREHPDHADSQINFTRSIQYDLTINGGQEE